jgi:2-methylcitrate dehydratase PrpD
MRKHLATLAAFATQQVHEALPSEVAAFARTLLLDTLGALVGGTRYPEVQALATQLGPGDLTATDPSFPALFRLGCASTWLDADSGGSFHPQGHRLPPVPTAHPAPHALPTLLSGAARGFDDDALLRVFAVSVEVGMRFGTATSLRPGMHPHGIHGPVAAAVAASLLNGHEAAATSSAMAQALSLPIAARLWQPMQGGTVRNAWTGLGAYYGARAAASPEACPPDALRAVITGDADLAALTEGLGRRWAFLDSYLKPYACARWIHPALDALTLALGDRPAAVERIDVSTFAYAASLSARTVRSDMHARFSLPVCLATLVLDGELHAAGFLPERLARPALSDLAARITITENPAFTAALPHERPTSVTVLRPDGTQTTETVRNARGNPDNPLTPAEIATKFRANVETVLPDDLTQSLLDQTGTRDLAAVARALA